MAMLKIASASDWTGLRDRPPVEVKISSRGLLRGDATKLAAEVGDRFISEVRKIEDSLDLKNHKYAHVISCGATEVSGVNRNGDGWSKKALATDMPTYLKYAKCFRDHRNKKDDEYYGRPKVAFYDEDRGYGRLLCEYHATEDACRDKLARIACREIEELERGNDIKASHGSKIAFDVCSACGNKAAKRSEYCDDREHGGDCHMFGCKHGLSKISEDGRIQFVDNPNNKFYDISSIGLSKNSARQADRIAYITLFDMGRDKVAGFDAGAVPGSAWLAEQLGMTSPSELISFDGLTYRQEKLARVAVELSEKPEPEFFDDYDADVSSLPQFWSLPSGLKCAVVLDLHRRGRMFGPRVWAKMASADRPTANLTAIYSRGLIRRSCEDDTLAALIKASEFTSTPDIPAASHLAGFDIPGAGTDTRSAGRREKLASIYSPDTNTDGADDKLAMKLAIDFAAIQILCSSQIF